MNVKGMVTGALVALALVLGFLAFITPGTGCKEERPECRYDIDALKKTDTNLLLKTGINYVKPAVAGVRAIAVDADNRIYVGGKTAVEVMNWKGVHVSGFDVSEPVRGLAVGAAGDIFVGLKDHVEVYGSDGTRKAVWKSPDPKTELTSIAVSSNFVFAADYVNRIVWRFTLSGEVSGRIGDKDDDSRKGGFVVPSAFFDVAAAADGSIWVVSPGQHRLEHFTADGKFLGNWGKFGMKGEEFCGCCNPSNMALMPDGSFVTSEKHIVRIKVCDPEGRLKGIISGQEEWEKKAVGLDLAVDLGGRILVLDPQADVVRIYAMK
jgi:hypothetical protein